MTEREEFEKWWKEFGRYDNKNTRREVTAWIGFRAGVAFGRLSRQKQDAELLRRERLLADDVYDGIARQNVAKLIEETE